MTGVPELTRKQKAELLIQGIEALGLDVDAELERIGGMAPGYERASLIQDYHLAALSARAGKLPADGGAP